MNERIIFLVGNDRERTLYRSLERGLGIDCVVTAKAQRDRVAGWREACEKLGVRCLECTRDSLHETVSALGPTVLVSIGFPYILSNDLLSLPKLAINVHPTLLPRYRGARSGYHILANNEPASGVTIHVMTEQMDRGDIIRQAPFPLSRFDTPASMMRKSRVLEADMLADVLSDIVQGKPLTFTQQDETKATEFAAMRTPADSVMDPQRPLIDLFDHIRACDPDRYPAFFLLDGQKVCVRMWRPDKGSDEPDLI